MRLVICLLATFTVLLNSAAQAKVYKCRDASGGISYSQVPCEKGSSQKTLSTPAPTRAAVDADTCEIIAEVSSRLYTQMRRGSSAQDLIQRHGGLSAINPRLLSLINYISGFRHNPELSSARLGELVAGKCRNGGFGNIQAADLPLDPEQHARQEYLQSRKQASQQQAAFQNQKSISVNFNNTPVSQAIADIASKAGVPIKTNAPIAGSVTMKLDNVPWMQPLSAIILQHNLQMGAGADGVWVAPK